MMLLTAKVND